MPLRHMSPQPFAPNVLSTTRSALSPSERSMAPRQTSNGRRGLLGTDPSSPNISARGSVGLLDTGMALILVALLPLYERFKPPLVAPLPGSRSIELVRGKDELRPVFEMHGVVVIPLAAPDEAMLLENMDDLPRNLVLVGNAAVGVGLRPCPILSVRAGNIDRNTESARALTIGPGDPTAIVGPLGRPQIRKEAPRQLIELVRHVLQRRGCAVDFGEFDVFAVFARQPHNVDRVRREAGGPAVAVHLFE